MPIKKTIITVTATCPDDLNKMISVAAYYLAEQRGFGGACQLHDWLEAEKKIHHIYGEGVSNK